MTLATRCSDIRRSSGEPLYGTATIGKGYIFLPISIRYWSEKEFNTRWASEKVLSLIDMCSNNGVRVRLYDPDQSEKGFFRGYGDWYSVEPARELIREMGLNTTAQSSSIDVFVCVHGKRDQCCALYGQSVYASARRFQCGASPMKVFRSSHLGGDRFAATAISFPSGNMYGALDATKVQHVLAGEHCKKIALEYYRGSVFDTKVDQIIKFGLMKFLEIDIAGNEVQVIEKLKFGRELQFNFVVAGKQYCLTATTEEFDFASSCKALDQFGKTVRQSLVINSVNLVN